MQLFQGDNVSILRLAVADASVHLTVTSPPYDNLRSYDGFSWNFENLVAELFRVTKPGGVVVWIVGDATINGSESGTSFRQALYFMGNGFNLHDTMIFHGFRLPASRVSHYQGTFDFMFIFTKGKISVANILREPCKHAGKVKGGNYTENRHSKSSKPANTPVQKDKPRTNIWSYGLGFGGTTVDKEAFKHPAIFPEKLAQDHILSWSNPGDLGLDPFLGSGTTGKMAVLNQREFIGIEISQRYLEIAKQRIAKARQ